MLAGLSYCGEQGILAVEMEAAALYAFAEARRQAVVCFAHVTNVMGSVDGDFEKGIAQGNLEALQVIRQTARSYLLKKAQATPE